MLPRQALRQAARTLAPLARRGGAGASAVARARLAAPCAWSGTYAAWVWVDGHAMGWTNGLTGDTTTARPRAQMAAAAPARIEPADPASPAPLPRPAVRSLASVGALLDQITYEIPLKEALQYPKGKEKWTRADVKVRRGMGLE